MVHNSLLVHMDYNGWIKYMSHFFYMCLFTPLNPQVIFHDIHSSTFDKRSLNILQIHHIKNLS